MDTGVRFDWVALKASPGIGTKTHLMKEFTFPVSSKKGRKMYVYYFKIMK